MLHNDVTFEPSQEEIEDAERLYGVDLLKFAEKAIDRLLESGAAAPFTVKHTFGKSDAAVAITLAKV